MRRRSGFTLVELLVAMALIVFLMSVLSQAFVAGLATFRDFKAIGDMNGRLRAATQLLADDLAGDHFDARRRLSDPNFWTVGPPREGFFRIWQQAAATSENSDLDGNPSFRSTGTWLHFAVKKRGNGRQDFFRALVPTGSPLLSVAQADTRYQENSQDFNSQWAEVAWFLRPSGTNAGSTPLFTLFRRQLVVTPDNSANWGSSPPTSTSGYDEVSCQLRGTAVYFNSPADLTVPERRFGMTVGNNAGVPISSDGTYPIYVGTASGTDTDPTQTVNNVNKTTADVVLTDVLSFDVRVLLPGGTSFVDLKSAGLTNQNSTFAAPITTITGSPTVTVFDTWSSVIDGTTFDYSGWATANTATSAPLQTSILAIQVSVRIWDFKTEQARQVTIIQDM